MRVLVTGGAGFIGSHVVEACLEAGHEVAVVDDLSHGRRENLPPDVPLYPVDIRSPALAEVLTAFRPDVVSHHAAQVSVAYAVAHPVEDTAVNVTGTVNVLDQARRHGVRKVILASSVAVYGNPQVQPCAEDHPLAPLSPYGLAKATCEAYVRLFHRLYGLPYTIFRYGNVYGPRQSVVGEAGVVAIFTHRMLRGEPTTIDGDGLQTRDFVYVEDIARANALALSQGDSETLNLGTGQATTVQTLWHELQRLTGYPDEPSYGPPRPGDIRAMVLDARRAAQVLGWRPRVTLADGLRRTVAAFRAEA